MNHSRYLRKNHATQEWGQLIFWDTETYEQVVPGSESLKLKLRLGVGRSVRREKGKPTRRRVVKYHTNEEFWKWFDSHLDPVRPTYAFAHNIGFDLTVSEFWSRLDSGDFTLYQTRGMLNQNDPNPDAIAWSGCFCDNDPPTIIVVKHVKTGAKVTFLDSMNYHRHSLEKIGEKLGIPKYEMPDWKEPDSIWFEYCERDVIVLEQAILQLMDWFKENDYGNFKMTQASLSMAAFRHRFYDHPVCLDNSPFYEKIERDSYYGGRLQMFRHGEIPGSTTMLDVVSQYPSVMHRNLFPVERVANSDTAMVKLGPEDMTREHIARVRLRTETSRYPLRVDGKGTIYPVGEFITTLCGPELIKAKQSGEIEEIYEWSRYRMAPLFRKFVTHFFQARVEAKERKDDVEDYFLKILMNTLYGKFGQLTPEWKDLHGENKLPRWVVDWLTEEQYRDDVELINPTAPQFFLHLKRGEKTRIKYRTIGKHSQISEDRKPDRNSFCAIAAFVTSYARQMMHNLIEIAGAENVYYVVTDSMFTSADGLERLRSSGRIRHGQLGCLALETQGNDFRLEALHHWRLGEKSRNGSRRPRAIIVCPGCRQPIDDDSAILPIYREHQGNLATLETKFDGIRGTLRRPDKDGVYIKPTVKRWRRSYNRGIKLASGLIEPLRYRVYKDRNVCLNDQ